MSFDTHSLLFCAELYVYVMILGSNSACNCADDNFIR